MNKKPFDVCRTAFYTTQPPVFLSSFQNPGGDHTDDKTNNQYCEKHDYALKKRVFSKIAHRFHLFHHGFKFFRRAVFSNIIDGIFFKFFTEKNSEQRASDKRYYRRKNRDHYAYF